MVAAILVLIGWCPMSRIVCSAWEARLFVEEWNAARAVRVFGRMDRRGKSTVDRGVGALLNAADLLVERIAVGATAVGMLRQEDYLKLLLADRNESVPDMLFRPVSLPVPFLVFLFRSDPKNNWISQCDRRLCRLRRARVCRRTLWSDRLQNYSVECRPSSQSQREIPQWMEEFQGPTSRSNLYLRFSWLSKYLKKAFAPSSLPIWQN